MVNNSTQETQTEISVLDFSKAVALFLLVSFSTIGTALGLKNGGRGTARASSIQKNSTMAIVSISMMSTCSVLVMVLAVIIRSIYPKSEYQGYMYMAAGGFVGISIGTVGYAMGAFIVDGYYAYASSPNGSYTMTFMIVLIFFEVSALFPFIIGIFALYDDKKNS